MDGPLDEQYLRWLYSQVLPIESRKSSRTFWYLLRQLYCTEFVWFVPNDDNRLEDGRDLRHEFLSDSDLPDDDEWSSLSCSMLEMFVAMGRRLSFQMDGEPRFWFWTLIENVELDKYNDRFYKTDEQAEEVNEVLERIIWRNYAEDGRGGLFPLKHPDKNQREVELWYQMSAYILEQWEEV